MTRVLAWVTAIVVAGLGAALGSWAGWQTAPPLASTETATEIASDAFAEQVAGAPTRTETIFGFPPSIDDPTLIAIFGGDGYAPGTVDVPLAVGPASPQAASDIETRRASTGSVGLDDQEVSCERGLRLLHSGA